MNNNFIKKLHLNVQEGNTHAKIQIKWAAERLPILLMS
ncbi:hypothetical protein NBRC111894_3113 [Sporolactobacillus inulinus]|uniref:Uncharacterized protein n=1 Tax=Sporolactobacillus inulinus TaxID=2078 RepID=A0A4Y1ZEW5_9BACL|nr:hypothetical protein NBRC111894_3113 [Sporolactobacillus inulinus]